MRRTCGGGECLRKYNLKLNREKREKHEKHESDYSVAKRVQGVFSIPDKQHRLIAEYRAKDGKVRCGCGRINLAPNDLRLECECGALWSFSLGETMDRRIEVVWMQRFR